MRNDNKNIYDLFILYIVIGALLISAIAFAVSIKSYCVSQDVFEKMNHFFIEGNRPNIVITPKVFEGSQAYLNTSQIDNELEIECKFEIKNKGKGFARDITFKEIKIIPVHILSKRSTLSYQRPPKFVLGPDDSFIFSPKIVISVESKMLEKTLSGLKKSNWKSFIRIEVSYAHKLDPSIKYRAIAEYDIDKEDAMPRKS